MLQSALDEGLLSDPYVYKRARHVVTENERTLAASEALFKHDYKALGVLMTQVGRVGNSANRLSLLL
jgi:galactokinase